MLTQFLNFFRSSRGYFLEYNFSFENDTVDHIIDHIYLGSCKSALEAVDHRPDIKYILNLSQYRLYAPEKRVMELDVEDEPEFPIELCFSTAHRFIAEAKKNNTAVLVHCRAGISRSATIVISYMMKYYNFSFDAAYAHVFARRNVIRPNDGFLIKLREYDKYKRI